MIDRVGASEASTGSSGIVRQHASADGQEMDCLDFTQPNSETTSIELVELKLSPPRDGQRSRTFPIRVELRFADETVTTQHWRIAVHLIRAELAATFSGCEIVPGTRYADTPLDTNIAIAATQTTEDDARQSGQLSANLITNSIKVEEHSKTAAEHKAEIVQRRVSTLPNNRWEFLEPTKRRLRGPYLVITADPLLEQPLCRVITSNDKASVELRLQVRTGDLDTEITALEGSRWFRWNQEIPNKNKIAKILIGKACTERFSRAGDERITLARAILEATRQPANR